MKRVLALLGVVLLVTACGQAAPPPPKPPTTVAADTAPAEPLVPRDALDARIDSIVAQMTLEEKIDQLCGLDFMDGRTNTRLNIPPLLMTDGPHGVRENFGRNTAFPTLVTAGATWDPELIERFGAALAEEVRGRGRNLILGPCINIHRTPLGGRNFESMGEDPWLISRLAVAYVKGVQSRKIGTSTKHFACNNQEWDRNRVSVEIDERTLREIYLPGFEAAVKEAGTVTVMGAYNRIDGDYCCENAHLLMEILKKEWGFRNAVLSDWWAIKNNFKAALNGCDMEMPGPGYAFTQKDLLPMVKDGRVPMSLIDDKVHRILRVKFELGLMDGSAAKLTAQANTPEHQALARELAEAGIVLLKNDTGMLPFAKGRIRRLAVIGPNAGVARVGGGGSSTVHPPYAVSPLEGIKKLCGRDVEVVYARGSLMGDLDPVPTSALRTPDDKPGLKAEYFANTDFSGTPVATRVDRNVAFDWGDTPPCAGLGADNYAVRWTGKLVAPATGRYAFSLNSDDGSRVFLDDKLLVDNWGDHGPQVRSGTIDLVKGKSYNLRVEYFEKSGGALMRFGWMPPGNPLLAEAVNAAKRCDAAVVFIGLSDLIEGEGVDRKNMMLPEGQDSLVRAIVAANPRTVVVLVNGTPVDMRAWVEQVPAIVEAWYPGMEGGTAIANILFGLVNPSGKLPVTFPQRLEDNPSWDNYPGDGDKVRYSEGVFVGYRHYDAKNIAPLFPFGHGLSYTTFAYGDLKLAKLDGGVCEVSFDVTNTGTCAGAEVAQVYVHDEEASVPRPIRELKGFKKVRLAPGERTRVTLRLEPRAFSFYDVKSRGWLLEPGKFRIEVGSSSRDIRLLQEIEL